MMWVRAFPPRESYSKGGPHTIIVILHHPYTALSKLLTGFLSVNYRQNQAFEAKLENEQIR